MEPYPFSFTAMGSTCKLLFCAGSKEIAESCAAVAMAEVRRLEERYSRYRPDSIISTINQVAAKGGTVPVDEETAQLLDYAFTCYQISDGLFDITSGVLREVWNFSEPRLPHQTEIDQLLPRIGLDKVELANGLLTFKQAGMQIDFGGIVKEYAADSAAAKAEFFGIRSGFVELGGDLHVIGPRPDGSPWNIGVRHPRKSGEFIGAVGIASGGVASSGDAEKYFELDGKRYCHILNPKTGYPIRGNLAAVTVVAKSCLVAGSHTSIALLKQDKGAEWLAGCAARHLWIDDHGLYGGNLELLKL